METKHYWASLQLLDRQIVDREGRLAGNVDDAELEADPDGRVYVRALYSGPGVLWERLGAKRLGRWLQRAHQRVEGDGEDPARIPLRHITRITDHVEVSMAFDEMGVSHGERWVREHLIDHLPGSDVAAE
jgi:hypothetical protein